MSADGIVEEMILHVSVWLGGVLAEIALLSILLTKPSLPRSIRWVLGVVAGTVAVITSGLLWVVSNPIWILPIVFSLYRVVNDLRAANMRLELSFLRSATMVAVTWIVVLQAIAVALLGTIAHFHAGYGAVGVLAALQLFVALGLLRTTTQTWSHTQGPVEKTKNYTDAELPSLSVLIPARNETTMLESCLQSLIDSDYPKLEIIALDDCSTNRRTPEIIRQYAHDGVRFVEGEVYDERRWLAKNHAYDQLATEASGDLLLFCGVDVLVERQTLRRMVEVLLTGNKDMLSVLPQRIPEEKRRFSLLQPMRYYWELCFPRRLFKRPPVLSTCWLIRREALESYGSFASVSRTITPEAQLAKKAVVSDSYTFVQSTTEMPLYSVKSVDAQYDTMVRVRYPQLHRRLEMVALSAGFELLFLLGPFVGFAISVFLPHAVAFSFLWGATCISIISMYWLVGVKTRLNRPLIGIVTSPFAFIVDTVMLHISMLRYEFGSVIWKERNICIPVMNLQPAVPVQPSNSARKS